MTAKETIALWGDLKDVISHALHVPHVVLHVVAGLLLYPLFARLGRYPRGSWRPLIWIAVLEGINELIDWLRYTVSGWPWTPDETILDIVATLGPIALVVWVWRRWSVRR